MHRGWPDHHGSKDVIAVPQQLDFLVADLEASAAFYRLLGWEFHLDPEFPHVDVTFPHLSVEFDQIDSARFWNARARPTAAAARS